MGGWPWHRKQTVESCLALSVFELRKWGVLKQGKLTACGTITWRNALDDKAAEVHYQLFKSHPAKMWLTYKLTERMGDNPREMVYPVRLTTTPCNLGGNRFWFECPLSLDGVACRRRAAKLYLPRNAKYFGCRHCYNLTYQSAQEHDARVDSLAGQPELIADILKDGTARERLMALKAALKHWKKLGTTP